MTDEREHPAIEVNDLTFAYPKAPPALRNINMKFPAGSRTLLVGDNGAGKSTLLHILNGRHLHEEDAVKVLGRSSFHDTSLNRERAFLGTQWGRRTVAFGGYGCVSVRVSVLIPPF